MTDIATILPIDDCDITISVGRDGTWINFSASNGQYLSLHVDNLYEGEGLFGITLRQWCLDREKQAKEIIADNGQFGVGA